MHIGAFPFQASIGVSDAAQSQTIGEKIKRRRGKDYDIELKVHDKVEIPTIPFQSPLEPSEPSLSFFDVASKFYSTIIDVLSAPNISIVGLNSTYCLYSSLLHDSLVNSISSLLSIRSTSSVLSSLLMSLPRTITRLKSPSDIEDICDRKGRKIDESQTLGSMMADKRRSVVVEEEYLPEHSPVIDSSQHRKHRQRRTSAIYDDNSFNDEESEGREDEVGESSEDVADEKVIPLSQLLSSILSMCLSEKDDIRGRNTIKDIGRELFKYHDNKQTYNIFGDETSQEPFSLEDDEFDSTKSTVATTTMHSSATTGIISRESDAIDPDNEASRSVCVGKRRTSASLADYFSSSSLAPIITEAFDEDVNTSLISMLSHVYSVFSRVKEPTESPQLISSLRSLIQHLSQEFVTSVRQSEQGEKYHVEVCSVMLRIFCLSVATCSIPLCISTSTSPDSSPMSPKDRLSNEELDTINELLRIAQMCLILALLLLNRFPLISAPLLSSLTSSSPPSFSLLSHPNGCNRFYRQLEQHNDMHLLVIVLMACVQDDCSAVFTWMEGAMSSHQASASPTMTSHSTTLGTGQGGLFPGSQQSQSSMSFLNASSLSTNPKIVKTPLGGDNNPKGVSGIVSSHPQSPSSLKLDKDEEEEESVGKSDEEDSAKNSSSPTIKLSEYCVSRLPDLSFLSLSFLSNLSSSHSQVFSTIKPLPFTSDASTPHHGKWSVSKYNPTPSSAHISSMFSPSPLALSLFSRFSLGSFVKSVLSTMTELPLSQSTLSCLSVCGSLLQMGIGDAVWREILEGIVYVAASSHPLNICSHLTGEKNDKCFSVKTPTCDEEREREKQEEEEDAEEKDERVTPEYYGKRRYPHRDQEEEEDGEEYIDSTDKHSAHPDPQSFISSHTLSSLDTPLFLQLGQPSSPPLKSRKVAEGSIKAVSFGNPTVVGTRAMEDDQNDKDHIVDDDNVVLIERHLLNTDPEFKLMMEIHSSAVNVILSLKPTLPCFFFLYDSDSFIPTIVNLFSLSLFGQKSIQKMKACQFVNDDIELFLRAKLRQCSVIYGQMVLTILRFIPIDTYFDYPKMISQLIDYETGKNEKVDKILREITQICARNTSLE
ncbi:hypothetical protein ADUPG1_012805 [Aduncisulcus paluster]|uniref:Uncharacterized protein n=1 Tax=Aduncisulcus paluster TaxID=2918883 RepID=A0ABQ5K4Y2_9EUKA|nr:hypothetical protein ADUPG1_012805 [Aduncisulcus paluster]|eukprot:gnl/Carplike_NY0171/843_a1158_1329.p1 GENE.gnl/Carplike_NY0171/843_a1158_1329~~gnl/Carplike_NY0171/843_a1158_1329.p1  ORF type:complete len:1105 (+),score=288.41 gnl/Carplike_NY0171/843_a1158_1329:93-3407(+)